MLLYVGNCANTQCKYAVYDDALTQPSRRTMQMPDAVDCLKQRFEHHDRAENYANELDSIHFCVNSSIASLGRQSHVARESVRTGLLLQATAKTLVFIAVLAAAQLVVGRRVRARWWYLLWLAVR